MTHTEVPEFHAIATPMGNNYLKAALFLGEQAKRLEEDPPESAFAWSTIQHSLVTGSLLNSACALEATINEWFSFADEIAGADASGVERLQRLWSMGIPRTASFQILQKYQVGLALMGKPEFSEGDEPFQSARLLVDLRNWLVHYEPTWEPMAAHEDGGDYPPHKLVRRLRGKFPLNPLSLPHVPFWPYKCLGSGCALWAAQSVTALIDEFFERCDRDSVLRPDKVWLERARELGRKSHLSVSEARIDI